MASAQTADVNEIVRIGQALASAQIRARESQKRALQAERLLRSVVTAVGDGSDSMLSSLSMEEWDLLQSFSAGTMDRSPSFTSSISSQSSIGKEDKMGISEQSDGAILAGSEIRTTHSTHFAESSKSLDALQRKETVPAWFPESAEQINASSSEVPQSLDAALGMEEDASPSASANTNEDNVQSDCCTPENSEVSEETKKKHSEPVAPQREWVRAVNEVVIERSENKREEPPCRPNGFLGLSSWGNVAQLLIGIFIGITVGSFVEKRLSRRRIMGMKAEIALLVEQVRRLQLTNEINQIYGSGLTPSSTVASTLVPNNETIDFNGAMSMMSFWVGLVNSSAEIS